MRLALLFLILMVSPAFAQDAIEEAPQVFGTWQVEPGNAKRAATIEFTRDENLSYGFSCWKNRWLFFFNYQAPEGGLCEDHEECESEVSEVGLTFQIPDRPDTSDQFTLFENYYFQDENLSVLDIEAMIKANHFRLSLDDKLKTIWQVDSLDFALDGFEKAVTKNKKTFSCALHESAPTPMERPAAKLASAKAKPEKVVSAKAKKMEAKKAKVKKSKYARAKAAKSKLPSHALKKSKKSKAQKAVIRKKHR
jgi:hypothetical protein